MPRKKIVKRQPVTASELLVKQSKPVAKPTATFGNKCVVCLKRIPIERVTALKLLGTPRTQWTHVKCSTTGKIKGIYMGEVGTSQLQLCDKVYNDSVRSVFRRTEHENDEDSTEHENE